MTKKKEQQRLLIQRLVSMPIDPKLKKSLMKHGLSISMNEILKKVPGRTIGERAKSLGVNRATWYIWRSGRTRPNIEKAKQLERITGYSVAEIRGVENSP